MLGSVLNYGWVLFFYQENSNDNLCLKLQTQLYSKAAKIALCVHHCTRQKENQDEPTPEMMREEQTDDVTQK